MGIDTMRERFAGVLTDLLDTDPRVTGVFADIGVSQLAATGALNRHPDRIVNVGIREQLMIGVAAGMALEGMRPVVHSYAPFLVERPFEALKLDLGHQGLGAIVVSIGASYDASSEGRTHQAPEDVALIGSLPGWEIYVPGHPDELESVLRHAVADEGPVYIRMSEAVNSRPSPITPRHLHIVREGHQATIIVVGPLLDEVVAASRHLDVTVLHSVTVEPFDAATLQRVMTGSDVVLVEPYLAGTSAHRISAALNRPVRLLSLGIPNAEHRRYGNPQEHAREHGLDVDGLRSAIDGFVSGSAI